jgi:hypothetical protein
MNNVQKYAKAIVAFVGAFLTAGSAFIPAEWAPWVSLGLAVVTTVATYQVPNTGSPTDALIQGDGLAAGDSAPEHRA